MKKDIIIRFMGGLGNQMFQYALYKELIFCGFNPLADVTWFDSEERMSYFIKNYFDIPIRYSSDKDCEKILNNSKKLQYRVARHVFINHQFVYYKDLLCGFDKKVIEGKYSYLDGFWQSEKYFFDVRNEILDCFRFRDQLSTYQRLMLAEIERNNSISIHVRRGDYLEHDEQYGGICTEEYYRKAINYFSNIKDAKYYVFSDDYDFCKSIFQGSQFVIVKPESKQPECNYDMYLMSKCNNNIIANSTFSWWGAYLNTNPQKIVIAPQKWNGLYSMHDTTCASWIKM